jgi:hypothetical protein
MTRTRSLFPLLLAAAWLSAGLDLVAQGDKISARLAWVPITGADRPNVTGKGTATGVLNGTMLTVTGSFEGLAAPATVVRLHRGIAKGARGPVITDLTVTKAVSGMISGTATLSPEDIENFRQGKLYLQLHSEKGVAPDGSNLWGWFLR